MIENESARDRARMAALVAATYSHAPRERTYGTVRNRHTLTYELLRIDKGKKPRRSAALALEKAGLATIGSSDQPVRLTKLGREMLQEVKAPN